MNVLGIESTAHTFGIGIISFKNNNWNILANINSIFKPKEKGKGIHPREAAEHHTKNVKSTILEAIRKAGITFPEIDRIAYSKGPGLGPCLIIGLIAAKFLAIKFRKPLIGVNHCVAHIEFGCKIAGAYDPVIIYTSGANTQIIAYEGKRFRVFGETLDIAIGNALDKLGRYLGVGHPGGPKIEEFAEKGKNLIKLPYSIKGMDLSFTGLITECERKIKQGYAKEDVCYSLQETAFAMLTEVTERALAHTGKEEVLLVGGVAENKRFCEMLKIMCKERGAKFFCVPKEYAGDNGAMIALTGALMPLENKTLNKACVLQKFRTDEVEVTWR
jgi:N6-L-threonylcarbamoyladenine synthase